MHHTGVGDQDDDERNERVDDEIHPGEVKGEEMLVEFFGRPDQIRAAHRQDGLRRLIAGELNILLLFGTEENQIVQVEEEENRINDDQRAKRMFVTENILIPNDSARHGGAFERNRAENPHGAVREVTGDELVSSTEVNRTLEKIRLKRVTNDQAKAIQGDQHEILKGGRWARERTARRARFTIELSATKRIEQPNLWNFFRVKIRMVKSEPRKPKGNNTHG